MENPEFHNDIDETVIFTQIEKIVACLLTQFKNLSNLRISIRTIGTQENMVSILNHGKMNAICNMPYDYCKSCF